MSFATRLGLHTDLYEIRMVESYLRLGMTEPATFSLFARPSKRRPVFVASGLGLALDVLDRFRFGPEEIDYLRGIDVPPATLDWLESLEVTGELWAVPEGTVLLGNEPIAELTAPLPVAQLLETALMNALHFDTLVATKAARCRRAADHRTLVDFGFRRAHGLEAGIRAAYAAYVGGYDATSNVEAGRRFGLPVRGTMAHSFIQSFDREVEAFRAFAADHPDQTTLLVETYDAISGIENAITVGREMADRGARLRAIRIDSEPLEELARRGRRMLDEAGLQEVKIFLSGGLDDARIEAIVRSGAPVDGFGVGSSLVVSTDKPSLDVAYKLVEYAGRGRAKYSEEKVTYPGRKQIYRSGDPAKDVLDRRDAASSGAPLLTPVWRDGQRLVEPDIEQSRRRTAEQLAPLPDAWLLDRGLDSPPLPTIGPDLEALASQVRADILGEG